MAKDRNPRIQARISEEMKQIFDEFLERKGKMGQAEFFEKYLPTLLISIDTDLFLELYEKAYGNKELEQMIKKLKGGDIL